MEGQSSQIVIFFTVICLLVLLLISFIVTIVFFYQKKSAKYITDIEKMNSEHEKSLLKTQLEIQESTLQNISREIHDNIGLSLTLAKLSLTSKWANNETSAVEDNHDTVELITNAIDSLRSLSRTLNSDYILNNGLIKSIEKELSYLNSISSFQFDLNIIGTPIYLDAHKELIIFRIAQEAYNNAIKHSNASKVCTIIDFSIEKFILRIVDNGDGFNVNDRKNSSGINNMRQRSQLLKGDCFITSSNMGTKVEVTIPY